MTECVRAAAQVPLFAHLNDNTMLALAQCLRPRIFLPQELLCVHGEEGHDMCAGPGADVGPSRSRRRRGAHAHAGMNAAVSRR